MIILTVTQIQGFTLSLEDTFMEKSKWIVNPLVARYNALYHRKTTVAMYIRKTSVTESLS